MNRFGASMRKACAVIQLSREVYLYQSSARDSTALVMRMETNQYVTNLMVARVIKIEHLHAA